MPLVRKKSPVVEAIQFFPETGHPAVNHGGWGLYDHQHVKMPRFWISTMESFIPVLPGDWIVKDRKGEYEVLNPERFAESYDRVEPEKGD